MYERAGRCRGDQAVTATEMAWAASVETAAGAGFGMSARMSGEMNALHGRQGGATTLRTEAERR